MSNEGGVCSTVTFMATRDETTDEVGGEDHMKTQGGLGGNQLSKNLDLYFQPLEL